MTKFIIFHEIFQHFGIVNDKNCPFNTLYTWTVITDIYCGHGTCTCNREEENVAFDPNKLTQAQKEELIARVESRTELQEGCMVWQGMARKHGYPQMKLGAHIAKVTGSPNKAYNPARILYSVHHSEILFKYSNNRLSHLCHNKLCCSIEHLTLEPLAINIQRNTCMREGTCVGHGNQPNCKIHAWVVSIW